MITAVIYSNQIPSFIVRILTPPAAAASAAQQTKMVLTKHNQNKNGL